MSGAGRPPGRITGDGSSTRHPAHSHANPSIKLVAGAGEADLRGRARRRVCTPRPVLHAPASGGFMDGTILRRKTACLRSVAKH